MRLTGNTIYNNTASGGSGGGVYVEAGQPALHNTIVAGNTSGGLAGDIGGADGVGLAAESGHNLVGTGGSGGLVHGANGNIVGSPDPGLLPLANYGGLTETHALKAGSAALDAGDNAQAVSAVDQRGVSRIADSADADATAVVDIGAFEAFPTIAAIADQTVTRGGTLSIGVSVGDVSLGELSVTGVSSNPVLVPDANIQAAGTGTACTLTVTPATGQTGTAVITLTVSAVSNGVTYSAQTSFTLTVTGASPSSNADLSGLQLSQGSLNPAFASSTTDYTVSVGSTAESIDIKATAADAAATLTVNGTVAAGGTAVNVRLNVGSTAIPIVVTAQDGTTKTYTVTVTRRAKSGNADLSNLTLSPGTIAFTGATSYTTTVASDVYSVAVTPTAADTAATLTVNGTAAASGAAVNVPLNANSSEITIVVTAEDGTTKTYTIVVIRADSSNDNAELTQIRLNGGGTSQLLAPQATNRYVYDVLIDPAISGATITAQMPASAGVTVTGSVYYWIAETAGQRQLVINAPASSQTVTANVYAGSASRLYTFNFYRDTAIPVTIPDDGKVTLPGGVAIDFSGAGLPQGTTVKASVIDPPSIGGMKPAGATMEITLSGNAAINQPVRLEIPLTNPNADPSKIGVFYYNPAANQWEYQKTDVSGGKAVAYVRHFSTYGVFEAERTEVFPTFAYVTDDTAEIGYSDAPAGTVIYYTLDGSTPTENSAKLDVTKKLTVSAGQTFTAYAVSPGRTGSLLFSLHLPKRTGISDAVSAVKQQTDQNADQVFNADDVTRLLEQIMPFTVVPSH
nr:cadherin-like beta sandwich domain-containing protein [Paenibacillus hamazuiensis]